MIKQLEQEASHLIGDFNESMLERGIGSNGENLFQKNRIILLILFCLKNKKCEVILRFYQKNIANEVFNKEAFFQNLLFLIDKDISFSEAKILLQKLLHLERYSITYVSLLSENLYRQIAGVNINKFNRKTKRISDSLQQVQRISIIKDSSKGYAEIVLALSTYIQYGIVKTSHNIVWNKIMNIIGTYDLDFYKVSDIIINKIANDICAEKDHILPLIQYIPFDIMGNIFLNKIISPSCQPQLNFVYICSIKDFTKISLQDIFRKGLYPYNHKYLKLARQLQIKQIYNASSLLENLPYFQNDQIAWLDLKRRETVALKVRQYTEDNTNSKQKNNNPNQPKEQILFGQLFGCFKLAILCQHARFNDFIAFESLYRQLMSQGIFDLTMHMPTLNQLVKTLEWIIDPMLYETGPSKYFKKRCRMHQPEKQRGFFQQTSIPSHQFFQNITLILRYIGVNIGYYNVALCKLIRLFCSILSGKQFKINSFEVEIMRRNIWQLSKNYLFPAITLQKQNFSLSMEMYSLLNHFSQQQRFHIYRYYYQQIMFTNPHLVVQFKEQYETQRRMINKLNRMNQQTVKHQLRSFAKRQHSHFFQSQFLLFTRSLNKKDKDQLALYARIFSSSTPIVPDIVFYLYLNYISKNQNSLVNQLGAFEPELENIHLQIYQLLKKCNELEPTMLLKFAINELTNHHQGNLHKFLSIVNILKDIIGTCLPNPQQYNSQKQKYEFLTYGMLLRVELSDKMGQYISNELLRQSLVKALCSSSNSEGSNSYFYQLMVNLSARYNQINIEKDKNMHELNYLSDLCFEAMKFIISLVFHEINWQKEIDKTCVSKYRPIPDTEILDLLKGENKIPFPLGCELLRAQKKNQISYHKNQVSSLKKLWDKVYKNVQVDQKTELQHMRPLKIFQVNSFILSDFYFYFWTSSMANLSDMSEKYKQISGKIRTIISQRQTFNSSDDLQKSNKTKYLTSYNLLQKQEEQYDRSFKNFNHFVGKPEKNKKMSLQAKYTSQQGHKTFINLLFINCILPRMTIDNINAVYCSRVVFKLVKQNCIPANKALQLIFNLVEGAISYVPYATNRQISCLSLFVSDFLRLFRQWDNFDEIQKVLRSQIGMEKFNESRFHKLKDYLQKYEQRLFNHLLINIQQYYLLRKVVDFFLKTEELPLSANQAEKIINLLSTIEIQTNGKQEEKSANTIKQSMLNHLTIRKSKLPYFPEFDNHSDRASVISVGSVKSFSSAVRGSKSGKRDKN